MTAGDWQMPRKTVLSDLITTINPYFDLLCVTLLGYVRHPEFGKGVWGLLQNVTRRGPWFPRITAESWGGHK